MVKNVRFAGRLCRQQGHETGSSARCQPGLDALATVQIPNYGFMDSRSHRSARSTYHALQTTLRAQELARAVRIRWLYLVEIAGRRIRWHRLQLCHGRSSTEFDQPARRSMARPTSTPATASPLPLPTMCPHWLAQRWIARGWQLNTIITAQSGRPVPIVSAIDTTAQNSAYPDAFQLSPAA